MVARSFQSFIQVSEPYKENGKMYISVKNPVNNKVRKVRWYTEDEFRKAFPAQEVPAGNSLMKNQNIALGFKEGYIHIFKGDFSIEENVEWFKLNKELCYNTIFGWFLPSTETLPEGMPEGFEMIKVLWDDVSNGEDQLGPKAKVEEHISNLLYPPSNSEWVAGIGQRIEITVTVASKSVKESIYGLQNTHIFEDAEGNVLGWSTSAKSLEVGKTYTLRGTVKNLATFRNIKTTWLTRCTIIND